MTLDHLNWDELEASLSSRGYAAAATPVLDADECRELMALYHDDRRFRSRIDMTRYRFGEGEYKYFANPLPPLVGTLRERLYPPLAVLRRVVEEQHVVAEAHVALAHRREPVGLVLRGVELGIRIAPDGYPETAQAWINTGSLLGRINFGLALASGRLPGVDVPRWLKAMGVQAGEGTTRSEQVDALLAAVLGGEASPETREILLRGDASPGGPASAPPEGPPGPALDQAGLIRLLGLVLGAPEMQRR